MQASIDSLLSTVSNTTSSTSNKSSTTSSSSASSTSGSLGKQDFLNLLVTQLKNQDPLNPQDSTQSVTQLAQFSELEAMQDVKDEMNELDTTVKSAIPDLTTSVQYNTGLYLINSDVRIKNDTITWDGDASDQSSVNINMGSNDSADVNILNTDGAVVRTITATADSSGVGQITWDGKDDNGEFVNAGKYTVQIKGADTDSSLYPFIEGVVKGVSSQNGSAMVRINGELYPISKLIDIA